MYQVGDTLTHAAYLRALARAHGYTGTVEAYLDGARLGAVSFVSGSVAVSARNRERRSLSLLVPEKLWPVNAGDLLSPYGVWLRATVTVTAGTTTFPAVPVFGGRLDDADGVRRGGTVAIKASDPFARINAEPFETARSGLGGQRIVDVIGTVIREVFPDAVVRDDTGRDDLIPAAGIVFDADDGSRGKAVDTLAASIGAEVYAEPGTVWPAGVFVIRPIPTIDTAPVWTITGGPGGVLIGAGDTRFKSGRAVVNRWIVVVERTDGSAPLYVTVTDDNPASPTRYGGPMGRLARFHRDQLITSEEQALLAGRAKLARSVGLARTRKLTVIANPAAEGGDVLDVAPAGEVAERHIADEFEVPLTVDPPTMDIQTRSTGAGMETE